MSNPISFDEYKRYVTVYIGLACVSLLVSDVLLFSVPCVLRVPNVGLAQRWRRSVIGGLVCLILASTLDIAAYVIFLVDLTAYDLEYIFTLLAAQEYLWTTSALMFSLIYLFIFLSLASLIIGMFSRTKADGRMLGHANLIVYGLASVLFALSISRFGLEVAHIQPLSTSEYIPPHRDLEHAARIRNAIDITWWIVSLGVAAGALGAYFTRKHLRGDAIVIICSLLWLTATTYQFATALMFRFFGELWQTYVMVTDPIFSYWVLCATLALFTYLGKRTGFWDYQGTSHVV
ncbi:hypothetical protein B0I35DRAFT_436167 [Stachybotrys elegans]|uniref:Uncharacterized protein n=1 Tax=Stachybotrys elegans TaxID=80388 RepID=A0A8K0SSV7_9HYPO|nr:hypothetical protein B0I35DRAFT_436167 [Stachybotrys elegans]